jgi:4-amino-4-deoxy-L-arabinose transferase-like glycosyltransferase
MTDLAKPMTNQWWINARQYIFFLVIVSGSAFLLLANLGNQYLWQDEAQTALISKTILTDGVPRGYDGKNFFSQERGAEYGNNYIWKWHTWLPFYVVAGFYEVFGVNTFVSRLPFALFGFGTVLVVYFFTRSLWPNTRIPAIAAVLLAVSVPFLLLCRQCRYYSMSMFFSVLSLYTYQILLQRRKFSAILLFIVMTLLFHTQHFYIGVLFPVVVLHTVIFRRERLKTLLVVIAAVMVFNCPWLYWLAGMNNAPGLSRMLNSATVTDFSKAFYRDIIHYVFPRWLLAVALISAVAIRARAGRFCLRTPNFWEKITLPVFFIISNVVVIAMVSPCPFFRYVAPSIPLLVILIAVIIDSVWRFNVLLAFATVAVLLTTSRLDDYFYEITHDYDGPEEGIVKYLNEHGLPEDTVVITYGDMPVKFYTKMRVIGGLTGEDFEPALTARWVILRKSCIGESGRLEIYLLWNKVDLETYKRIEINYPDTPWENREDIDEHYFRTCTDEDNVVIYERTN